MIQLIVKVSTKVIGSSVLLFPDCDQNDTIESIKLKISEQTGIPPEQQRLIVLGQLMLDENTLGFYNIKRGERTITLRDPLTTEGEMQITVAFGESRRNFPFKVDRTELIEDIDQRLCTLLKTGRTGIFSYYYNHNHLKRHQSLTELNIEPDTAIVAMSGGVRYNFGGAILDKPTNSLNGFLFGINPMPTDEDILRTRHCLAKYESCSLDTTKRDLLSAEQRQTCIDILNEIWEVQSVNVKKGETLTDLKVQLDYEKVKVLWENPTSSTVQQLFELSNSLDSNRPYMVLHCSKGPMQGVVDWHVDNPDRPQVRIALNDSTEYEGGRMCYFTPENGIVMFDEIHAGDVIRNQRDAYEAVTLLTSGNRYYLTLDNHDMYCAQRYLRFGSDKTKAILKRIFG